jgi:hypothetical protein
MQSNECTHAQEQGWGDSLGTKHVGFTSSVQESCHLDNESRFKYHYF